MSGIIERGPNGRWLPGVSGNPGGLGTVLKHVVELAREHTEDAIRTLHEIALDRAAPAMARAKACEIILERGWGKPAPSAVERAEDMPGPGIVFKFRVGPDDDDDEPPRHRELSA